MTDSYWLNALIVSVTTLASAWCWVVYNRAISERRAVKAGLADVALVALSMISMVSVVEDHRMAGPILVSAFLGTFFAVKR